ncbi:MAG: late competence development ComFB family protein [Prochloraceae cyanobacterium]|nr:late competence development ComFB family protein [Prochloraceae cyanobacterium]
MSLEKIAARALKDGFLTPGMQSSVEKICTSDSASELSLEEYTALDRIMRGILDGEVISLSSKKFINVMEELVLGEAIVKVAEMEQITDKNLDVGDIAAYALNRLPPLYATTSQGATYQRQLARKELQQLISHQVRSAIYTYLQRPESIGELIGQVEQVGEITKQISSLLQSHASDYEAEGKT